MSQPLNPPMSSIAWVVGTALAAFAVAAFVMRFIVLPAGGDGPAQAGPVVRVTVGAGHGSGVHIGGGYVLTAQHVVASSLEAPKDKPLPVTIRADDGSEAEGEVLWASAGYDVALVKVYTAASAADLDCRPLVVGETVMAWGNPLTLQWARSWGRVSTDEQEISRWPRAVAMDAAVMPGSSGGPIFDEDGDVVGLVVAMNTSGPGYSFVVPATVICELLAIRD